MLADFRRLPAGGGHSPESAGADTALCVFSSELGRNAGQTMSNPDDSSRAQSGPILLGLVFIFVGLALLTDRIGLSGIHLSGPSWPVILIVYGLVRLLASNAHPPNRRRPARWTGAWFIYLGLWFFVNEFHLFGLGYDTSWPLLIVWAGVRMMWCAIENAYRPSYQRIEGS